MRFNYKLIKSVMRLNKNKLNWRKRRKETQTQWFYQDKKRLLEILSKITTKLKLISQLLKIGLKIC